MSRQSTGLPDAGLPGGPGPVVAAPARPPAAGGADVPPTEAVRLLRRGGWVPPPPPVHREVVYEAPSEDLGRPPVLFVPGLRHGAWCFTEHWLPHTAGRGFPGYAMSLRGHGGSGGADLRRTTTLEAYVQDVLQVVASLPSRAVLVGHGVGGLVVAHALARYPAHAGVLVAPVMRAWRTLGSALLRHPFGTLPGLFGRSVGLRGGQLFSRGHSREVVRRYRSRLDPSAPRVQYQLLFGGRVEPAIPGTAVLVVGSPHDRLVSQRALRSVAGRYHTSPLLFPDMGHDMMLETRWVEPIDAILDWLATTGRP